VPVPKSPEQKRPERSDTVAAFDFDGTLTRRDSLVPFLAQVCGWPRVTTALSALAPRIALALSGHGDRDAAKEALLKRLLAGRKASDVAAAGERYAASLRQRGRLRPEMLDRVHWHREQGHALVLVSASLTPYLDPLGDDLGFDAVLATRLAIDSSWRLTGRFDGNNVRGAEKVARLEAWLAGDRPTLWVYGNSQGDAELLAIADAPRRVRRRGRSGTAV
jgi:phosphatidylglycerophosphatase C